MKDLLKIEDLHAGYGPSTVLRSVTLSVKEGGVTIVLGANGAGKTTLLRSICNLTNRSRGSIWFSGTAIENYSTEDIARLGIAHVPDGRGTFLNFTVMENLQLGANRRRDYQVVSDDLERVFNLFPRLRERRRQLAGTLSGGEQQMLAIARTLMQAPRLILLDEPSFGLAPMMIKEIFATLERINRTDGVSLLIVEQSAKLALKLATDAYVLAVGEVALSGPSEAVSKNDLVRRAYFGGEQ